MPDHPLAPCLCGPRRHRHHRRGGGRDARAGAADVIDLSFIPTGSGICSLILVLYGAR
jgi:hypothetical protein